MSGQTGSHPLRGKHEVSLKAKPDVVTTRQAKPDKDHSSEDYVILYQRSAQRSAACASIVDYGYPTSLYHFLFFMIFHLKAGCLRVAQIFIFIHKLKINIRRNALIYILVK